MKIDIVSFVLYSNCKTNAPSRLARARRLSFSGQAAGSRDRKDRQRG